MNWFLALALVLAASPSLLDASPAMKNRHLTARNDLLRMFERELLLGKMASRASHSEDETEQELTGSKPESDSGISDDESDSSGSGGSGGSGDALVPFHPTGGRPKPSRGNRRPSKSSRRPHQKNRAFNKPLPIVSESESDYGSSGEESDSSGSGGSGDSSGSGGSGEGFGPFRPSRPAEGNRRPSRPAEGNRRPSRPAEGNRRPSRPKEGGRKPSRPSKGARRPSRPNGGNRKSPNRSDVRLARRYMAHALRQMSKN